MTKPFDVAHHEAGHAIVAHDLGLSVILIELLEPEDLDEPTPNGRVVTAELERYRYVTPAEGWASDAAYRHFLERDFVQRMAGGPAALRGAGGDPRSMDLDAFKELGGTGGDFWASWRLANQVARCDLGHAATASQCHSATETRLREALSMAVEIIERRWDEVLQVAEALRGQRRLDADGFKRALDPEFF